MTTAPFQQEAVRNQILGRLPAAEFAQLAPLLTPAALEGGRALYGPEEPLRHVYFVTQGVLSLVSTLDDGTSIAVAAVGREGVADLTVLLGGETSAHQATVQIGGAALRLRTEDARAAFRALPHFRDRLLRYTRLLLTLVSQTTVCNALHTVEERLARWLLVCGLRLDTDTLPLTHELLSHMLGVRRSGVTVACGVLERAGLVAHGRGRLTILDRAGLRHAACECVRVLTEEYEDYVRD